MGIYALSPETAPRQKQPSPQKVSSLDFFDANIGRWINRDPIEEQGGINVYGFVGNNGITNIDCLAKNSVTIPGNGFPCDIVVSASFGLYVSGSTSQIGNLRNTVALSPEYGAFINYAAATSYKVKATVSVGNVEFSDVVIQSGTIFQHGSKISPSISVDEWYNCFSQ